MFPRKKTKQRPRGRQLAPNGRRLLLTVVKMSQPLAKKREIELGQRRWLGSRRREVIEKFPQIRIVVAQRVRRIVAPRRSPRNSTMADCQFRHARPRIRPVFPARADRLRSGVRGGRAGSDRAPETGRTRYSPADNSRIGVRDVMAKRAYGRFARERGTSRPRHARPPASPPPAPSRSIPRSLQRRKSGPAKNMFGCRRNCKVSVSNAGALM